MRIIADFHVHSKYSRATSRDMDVENMAKWAKLKGINLLGTGDFTHPTYFAELMGKLKPEGNGLFSLKKGDPSVKFMLTGEVSNIFSSGGRLRKVHCIIFLPSFEAAEKLNSLLSRMGKIGSDGRPVFGFPVKDLVKMVYDISPDAMIIPAHVWTPWFSLFGSFSGFDSIEEAFEDQADLIRVIETGLSSDPQMNWRLSALDNITLISNSDAHSPSRIGREANVFNCPLTYRDIVESLKTKSRDKFRFTIEFFPQEGKYHFDGHRNCGVSLSPAESRKYNNRCPVCNSPLTIGVMHRVEELADRPEGYTPEGAIPAKHLIPLEEIIADALGVGVGTERVEKEYRKIVSQCGSEFNILLNLTPEELSKLLPQKIYSGVIKVREGCVKVIPGYDGIYGKVSIAWDDEGEHGKDVPISDDRQMKLF